MPSVIFDPQTGLHLNCNHLSEGYMIISKKIRAKFLVGHSPGAA